MGLFRSSEAGRRHRRWSGTARTALVAALVIGASGGVMSASAADPATISQVVLLVGSDESQRVVNWYASANTTQVVEVAPTADLVAGVFPASAVSYPAVVAANTAGSTTMFNGHAVLTDLVPDTSYSYHVGEPGAFSPTYTFRTQAFSGDFEFIFLGDPQIGASGNVAQDQAGWEATLDVAMAADPDIELFVSGGDQVETANTESQWTAFLAPDEMRSVPWASTIGNHDVGGKAYDQHLWTPNTDRSPKYYNSSSTSTRSGGDYWYTYKDVLFIHLNSNAYSTSGQAGKDADEAHLEFVTGVVTSNPTARYTVLVYHHAIYSPAAHANDGDAKERRKDFPAAFSALGVDLVLQGHDHAYSRSYVIDGGTGGAGKKANPDEQPGAASVVQGPGGVIYVTGNSASGSKYYDLTNPTGGVGSEFGPDPLNPDNHWANSVENQEHVRTYVKVSVADGKLVVENIRAGVCGYPNSGQGSWCGPNNGASPASPIGSIQDRVEITPLSVTPPDEVPEATFPVLLALTGLIAAAGALGLTRQRRGRSAAGA